MLYNKYLKAEIGTYGLMRAYELGYINKESFNVIAEQLPSYSLEQVQFHKAKEFNYFCGKNIDHGIDVTLSSGETEHFSLTDTDQININSALTEIMMGATDVEYHSDNGPFKVYSADDMLLICTTAQSKVKTETAYRNNLREWIKQLTDVEEIRKITYGTEIPEEYWTEGWRSIQEKIKKQQEDELKKVNEQVAPVTAEEHDAVEEVSPAEEAPKEGIVTKAVNAITGKSSKKRTTKNTKTGETV